MFDGPSDKLNPVFRSPWWNTADPPVLLDTILSHVESEQRNEVVALYLDNVVATLEANLRFVQGMRSVVTSAKR
jgi:hypothetical protein